MSAIRAGRSCVSSRRPKARWAGWSSASSEGYERSALFRGCAALSLRDGRGHRDEGIEIKGSDFAFDRERLVSESLYVLARADDDASGGDMIGHG